MSNPTNLKQKEVRLHLGVSIAAVVLLGGGVGGWAAMTDLSGAVIAPGQLVVDSNVKKVQHPTGGVVSELRVKDGDHVDAGDVLIRVDDTQTRANLSIIIKALDELAARQARNLAERDQIAAPKFPPQLLARSGDAEVRSLMSGETTFFELRRSARQGQQQQLSEQITQLNEQISGLMEQQSAKRKEIDWVRQELDGVRSLWQQKLVQFTRVSALEREAARLDGERGTLIATIAQAKGKVAETKLKIIQVDEDLRSEVSKELGEIRAKMSEYAERRLAAEDQLKRVVIRAPQSGTVHQMVVHTVGGVAKVAGARDMPCLAFK